MLGRVFIASLVVVLGVAAATAAVGGAAMSPCVSGLAVAKTASYHMGLDVGKQENMYTPAEVKARHLKTGEIMLGGQMTMMGKTPAGMRMYHLEVHICNTQNVVVRNLMPTIDAGGTMVSPAIMIGIGAPPSDYHYGNDVALKPGAKVTVKVTVKGQTATFHTTVPMSSGMGMGG